ncbi:HD domain-containing phosphohydrolase [uncultured Pseudodesulfovibrio sp.]|uniref:HD-GYP domain-containing protein n=1 Tax=uncultured Pseudodesulfovibrio sp. TaxID=2035858 RepID=UPI0029C7E1C8|nr:HD domain-containing phosphohydrolase [uncultured Pseudodesulfovibrio sp.]
MNSKAKPKHDIPDGLNEEYYQISADILGSFNKYRPPLNIFEFKEDVCRIAPFYKVGGRLSNGQIEELASMVNEGLIFVSRDDHPVYVKHISYQLDLVLVDKNLKEREIADIFTQALTRRMKEFLDQPVPVVFEKLWVDLMVLTEYLHADIHRTRGLVRRMHKEHSLENHSVNCGFLGLALFGRLQRKDCEAGTVKRQTFDRLAAGLFLHDMGMTKVAQFIRDKKVPLTGDERTKVNAHTRVGYDMMTKLNLKYPEVEECISQHHERLNGSGYPLKTREMGFAGRLCAVVDSFCAMITSRPYGEGLPMLNAAVDIGQDKRYDPTISKALQLLLVQDLKMKP